MRRFVKTTVPADGYEEVRKVGDKYVVHMEPVSNGDGSVTCYECMTDSEPDMEVLGADLQTWKVYVAERALAVAKQQKIAELMAYDNSTAVNGFIIRTEDDDFTEWLDPNKRNNASRAIESAKKLGIPTLTTAIGDIPVTLTTEDADTYLAQLEMYAVTCAGMTAQHKAAIMALTSKEAVEGYDFTQGYPPKLTFTV